MAAGDRTRSRELYKSTVHWVFRRRPRHRPRILESDPAGPASHAFRCLRSTNQDGPARRVVQAVLRIADDHEPLRLAARNLSVMRRPGTVSAVSPRAWDDPAARVGDREAAEACALHVIADLASGRPNHFASRRESSDQRLAGDSDRAWQRAARPGCGAARCPWTG